MCTVYVLIYVIYLLSFKHQSYTYLSIGGDDFVLRPNISNNSLLSGICPAVSVQRHMYSKYVFAPVIGSGERCWWHIFSLIGSHRWLARDAIELVSIHLWRIYHSQMVCTLGVGNSLWCSVTDKHRLYRRHDEWFCCFTPYKISCMPAYRYTCTNAAVTWGIYR